jgi:hypothetical protein
MQLAGLLMPFVLVWATSADGATTDASAKDRPSSPATLPGKYTVTGMDEYMPIVSQVLSLLTQDKIDEGMNLMAPPWVARGTPEMDGFKKQLTEQFRVIRENCGNYHGCEAISTQALTSRLQKVNVLCFFDKQPVIFKLVMYKSKDTWLFLGGCQWETGNSVTDRLTKQPAETQKPKPAIVAASFPVGTPVDEIPAKVAVPGMQEYMPLISQVIAAYAHGDVDKGCALVDPTPQKGPQIDAMKHQIKTVHSAGGAYYGHEVISVQRLTDRLHRVTLLVLFERMPFLYSFNVYKAQDSWRFWGFQWTNKPDEINALMEKQPMISEVVQQR